MSAAAEFKASVVEMKTYPVEGTAIEVKKLYEGTYGEVPETPNGWFHRDDWPRTAYVLSRMDDGERALDVGVGAGQFLNMVALSGKYSGVYGADPTRFGKYIEYSDLIHRTNDGIDKLPYPDDHFDVVTCMEVLEHIPEEIFTAGLAELRRVCRGQLLMTVPFEEPEPISKTHVRRFERQDVVANFPDGRYTILNRWRMPWVLIEERMDGKPFAPLDEPMFDDTPKPKKAAAKPAATASQSTVSQATGSKLTAEQRRIEQLEATIARLKSRRSVRTADWAGAQARRVKQAAKRRLGK